LKCRKFIKFNENRGILELLSLLFALSIAFLLIPNPAQVSASAPGGLFVTGYASDYQAQDESGASNPIGAQHIIQRAVAYVTYGNPKPRILLIAEGGLKCIACSGLRAAGFPSFAVADYGSETEGVLNLKSVQFGNYDVIVVSSDIGSIRIGSLGQAEVDILNLRSSDLLAYVNDGGGLVVFAEGAEVQNRFGFLPFLGIGDIAPKQTEIQNTVSPLGLDIGFTSEDVNGNISYNYFTSTGNLSAVVTDPNGDPLSLAVRGSFINQTGLVPTDTPVPTEVPVAPSPASPAPPSPIPSPLTILAIIIWLGGMLLFEGLVAGVAINLIRRTPQPSRSKSGQNRSTVRVLSHQDVGTQVVEPSAQVHKPAIRINSNQGTTTYSIEWKKPEKKTGE